MAIRLEEARAEANRNAEKISAAAVIAVPRWCRKCRLGRGASWWRLQPCSRRWCLRVAPSWGLRRSSIDCAAHAMSHRFCACRSWRRSPRTHDGLLGVRASAELSQTRSMRRTMARKPDLSNRPICLCQSRVCRHVCPWVRGYMGWRPASSWSLPHSLAEALETERGCIAQFVAPESGAGTEDVGYDLAYISAAWLGKRVLFVNGTGMHMDAKRTSSRHAGASRCLAAVSTSPMWNVPSPGWWELELYQMTMPSMRGALDIGAHLAPDSGIPDQAASDVRSRGDRIPGGDGCTDGRAAVALCRRQHTGAEVRTDARTGCDGVAGVIELLRWHGGRRSAYALSLLRSTLSATLDLNR